MSDDIPEIITDINWNASIENIYNEISLLNPVWLKEKSFLELSVSGLNIYKNVPGCTTTSLFLLDSDDFNFHYKASLPFENENSEKEKLDVFIEKGIIAEALNSLQIIIEPVVNNHAFSLAIPLLCQTGVMGVVLASFSSVPVFDGHMMRALRTYSNQFALVLQCSQIEREINNLKENVEQIVALRTLNLSQSTRDMKFILDSVQTGILMVEKKSDLITDANVLAADIIGTAKDSLIGRPSYDFFFKAGKSAQPSISTNQEGLLRKKNGSFIPIIRTIANIEIGQREVLIISFIDISQRKQMEDELQRTRGELELRVQKRTAELTELNLELQIEIERRVKAEADLLKFFWAVQQNPTMITLTDAQGVIEYVNPKFTETTQYDYSEISGQAISNFYANSSLYGIENTGSNGFSMDMLLNGEHTCIRKDGTFFLVSTLISPIIDSNGIITNYVIVQEDITLKREAAEQIIIAKEKAEESDKLKTNILANMSHELRTPLISVLGFSEILAQEITDDIHLDFINKIRFSGKRLLHTLNTMLFLSQLQNKELHKGLSLINISETVKITALSFSEKAAEKNLAYHVSIPEVDLFIEATEEMISTALIHLIENAIKFTKKGRIDISLSVLVDAKKSRLAEIRVADTGIGITENALQFIFDPFRQDSEGYGRNFEGSGLGLTLAKKICTLIGGDITVESQLNKGTVFILSFPIIAG
ncbi:MAG: PAS domain S-box protein [Ignavibacteriales bacterium]|nr:PAS domain S-box protein [Ignavibacteriales bacterium]